MRLDKVSRLQIKLESITIAKSRPSFLFHFLSISIFLSIFFLFFLFLAYRVRVSDDTRSHGIWKEHRKL